MRTVRKPLSGKNELWAAYQAADPFVRSQIYYELLQEGEYRHLQTVASKEGYNLKKAHHQIVEIFTKHLPETAPLFGLPPIKKAPVPKPKAPSPAPLFEQ